MLKLGGKYHYSLLVEMLSCAGHYYPKRNWKILIVKV